MIGCSTIAFTPTPMGQVLLLGSHALAGLILGRSRRPLSGRCLSALGVRNHRRGSRIKHKVSVAKPASSAVLFSDLPPKWVTRPVSPSVLSNGIGITSG